MNFLRNPEIKKLLLIEVLISIICSVIGFVFDVKSGILVVFCCVLLVFSTCFTTYKRYKRISDYTQTIDKILHNDDSVGLKDFSEGELALLNNEVLKLTIRLREQADKLKADKTYLADSIADISHQIRTPLTSMNLVASMLYEPDIENERKNKLVKELEKSLARIDWQINALLKISKLDTGTARFEEKPIDVNALIKKSVEPIAISMDLRNQKLVLDIEDNCSYNGDYLWSVEAVSNILKNCMEHTGDFGKIVVKAVENAIFTEILITDNGEGIDKDDLPHLFERFYKGKNSSEQSIGIGLALSRMIIQKQNGVIKAQNNKDSGSTFSIRFYKSTI